MSGELRYISTRGEASARGYGGALMAGLAEDGGLFVPESWPKLTADDLKRLASAPYTQVATDVVARFAEAPFEGEALRILVEKAYRRFTHASVAPLVQCGPQDWVLELFHGPTLAFKDVAMQLLGLEFEMALAESGKSITIVGATSGDTGAAAMEAFQGRSGTNVFILFPHGRVSPFQQRQMTTIEANNTYALSVDGTFDDCQRILKEMFADEAFRIEIGLSGVNSINWARLVPQIVYYITSSLALGAAGRPVSYVVPTGNFGDIYAGYIAKKMGAPIGRLIIATNTNDILARCLKTGRYEVEQVVATTSPSMDIQVSSNFERLLFDASGNDHTLIRNLMGSLSQSGSFEVPTNILARMREDFSAETASELEVKGCLSDHLAKTGTLIDPHTAVGQVVAAKCRAAGEVPQDAPLVVLATAHPAKFAAAVTDATGYTPDVPSHLVELEEKPERLYRMAADASKVKAFIRECLTNRG